MPTPSQHQLSHEESLALYERQTGYVHAAINQNATLLNVFDNDEFVAFEKYFLPDWTEVGNFVHYYEKWEKQDPEMIVIGNELLQKFLQENKLDGTGLLIAE